MYIYLDDERKCPKELPANVAKNYTMCKIWIDISHGDIDFIDLDYDLGEEKTGLDVLFYLKEKNYHPKAINIHSDHPEGSIKMIRYAEDAFPNSNITFNTL